MLERHGFKVITAENGEEGLVVIKQHLPDLILCDLDLPGTLDGAALLRYLRITNSTTSLATIPFLFVSGHTSYAAYQADQQRFSDKTKPNLNKELAPQDEVVANGYIVKPFTLEELLAAVHSQLGLNRIALTSNSNQFNLQG
jgi:CheY-like chemotaxis protein